MLSLGNALCYRTLLELAGNWAGGVCVYPLGQRGCGIRRGMYAVFGECCLLPLLAGAGGAVRGGEVGEWGIGLAVCCACILWGKGIGDGDTLGERME